MPDHPVPETDRAGVEAPCTIDLEGTPRDATFDCMLALARGTFDVPMAAVTLSGHDGVVPDAYVGLDRRSLQLGGAFFDEAIASGRPVVVEDTSADDRFGRHPLVTDGPRIRFFAAVPLDPEPGCPAGALNLFDTRPRHLTPEQAQALAGMGQVVTALLRQRRDAATVDRLTRDLANQAQRLQEQEALLAHSRKIFEHSSAVAKIGVWECDLPVENLRWSNGVYDLFELPRGSTVSRARTLELYSEESLKQLEVLRTKAIAERGGFTLDAQIKTARGNVRWMRLTANVESENGVPVRIFGMKQDITEQKALWDRTRFLAECDTLTGLANRGVFQARLAGQGEEPAAAVGALLLVDLDGFKQVNDTFGHALGDECLKEVAVRLRHACRDAELVARIGGDEFAVLLGPDFDRRSMTAYAARILDALRQPVQWRGQSFQLGASIGIAEAAGSTGSPDLFVEADLALYAAKAAGRNTARVFTPDLKSKAERRFEIVKTIGDALAEDRLELFYQPKVHMPDGALSGFEALLRCHLPGGRVMAGDEITAAFEDPELSNRLGRWVIENALAQARRWTRAGCDFGHIAINLSSAQLRVPQFADSLVEQIARHGLRPDMIEVEVTEGVLLGHDTETVGQNLRRLRDGGLRIALDDFGTGYASLVHLRTYPIDLIKISRTFVRQVMGSTLDRAGLEATIGLGQRLGIDIVAVGIETSEQLDYLRAMGCRLAQGFHFSKPLPAEQAAAWHNPLAASNVIPVRRKTVTQTGR